MVTTSTGLIKDYYVDPNTQSYMNAEPLKNGLEEALKSYDVANAMAIMVRAFHEFGAYQGMTKIARKLTQNFEDWVSVLYSSPADLTNNRTAIMEKMQKAMGNLRQFVENYSIHR